MKPSSSHQKCQLVGVKWIALFDNFPVMDEAGRMETLKWVDDPLGTSISRALLEEDHLEYQCFPNSEHICRQDVKDVERILHELDSQTSDEQTHDPPQSDSPVIKGYIQSVPFALLLAGKLSSVGRQLLLSVASVIGRFFRALGCVCRWSYIKSNVF